MVAILASNKVEFCIEVRDNPTTKFDFPCRPSSDIEYTFIINPLVWSVANCSYVHKLSY